LYRFFFFLLPNAFPIFWTAIIIFSRQPLTRTLCCFFSFAGMNLLFYT
jgi:hypothetical protein